MYANRWMDAQGCDSNATRNHDVCVNVPSSSKGCENYILKRRRLLQEEGAIESLQDTSHERLLRRLVKGIVLWPMPERRHSHWLEACVSYCGHDCSFGVSCIASAFQLTVGSVQNSKDNWESKQQQMNQDRIPDNVPVVFQQRTS